MEFKKSHFELADDFLNKHHGKLSYLTAISVLNSIEGEPSYEQFAEKIQSMFIKGTPLVQMGLETNTLYHLTMMRRFDKKLYYITPNLASRLATTSLGIDSHFVRSPFPEIFVQIDKGLFSIKDIDGTDTSMTGFYVNLVNQTASKKMLRIMASGMLPAVPGIPFNDSLFYFKLPFESGAPVDEQVREALKNARSAGLEQLKLSHGERNLDYLEGFAQFVINTLLYITSRNARLTTHLPEDFEKRLAGLKNPAKIRKLQNRADRFSNHPIIVAGEGLDAHEGSSLKDAGSVKSWVLEKRVRVSGHWREQWYGSEKDGTKHQEALWISDYEKGPELADVISNPHIVK